MCEYAVKNNESKIVFLDIWGGSATIRTRRKSRITKGGFNVFKIDKKNIILYILNINISADKEEYRVYKVDNIPFGDLIKIKTGLEGYDETILKGIELGSPIIDSDSLDAVLFNFNSFEGECDVVIKYVEDRGDHVIIKHRALVQRKLDEKTNKYYFFNTGGHYREALESILKTDDIVEYKNSVQFSNIINNKA